MNIKKKHFHEKDNRKLYEQNNNKNEITENLIESKIYNHINKNKNLDFQINDANKETEINMTKNQSNIDDKKFNTKKSNNNNCDVKVIFERNNKMKNINENYLKDNRTKKIQKIQKDNINNGDKLKIPQDNLKKKFDNFSISKKSFNNKKNNKNIFEEYLKKDKENKFKTDSLDTGKVIFNNIFKKNSLDSKSLGGNLKPIISDEILQNILLFKQLKSHKKEDISSDNMSDYNLKEKQLNNKDSLLYFIKEEKDYLNKIKNYSNSDEYDCIIKNNITDKITLSLKLLQLEKRKWYEELKLISDELKEMRDKINKDDNMSIYLNKLTKIHEHFNWIINGISTYYNILFQNNKQFNDILLVRINLPDVDSALWNQGFDWKGLFIIALPENKSGFIKNEIKALKYCFFDYLQIIEKHDIKKNKQLSSELIFPLIGYSLVNDTVIFVSAFINPDKSFNNDSNFVDKFISEIIAQNKGIIEYYYNSRNSKTSVSTTTKSEEDENTIPKQKIYELIGQIEKNYYIDDLLESECFMNMSEFHLIPFIGGKFIIINAYKLIPNLFEIKFDKYKAINVFSEMNSKYYHESFLYDVKSNSCYNDNDKKIYQTPKNFLEKYNINIFQQIKVRDLNINKVKFRILFENIKTINKTNKFQSLADNLINYGDNLFNNDNKITKSIGENYLIIYDLIEPIKLEYSLITNFKNDKNAKKSKIPFYLKTNFASYFLSWCKSLNKNSYNIKTYSELKYHMKKFGINSQLKFFSLLNIDNDEIADIIKISILTKLIKYVFNLQKNNIIDNSKKKYFFEDERIGKIFFFIKSILYVNEFSFNEINKFESIYKGLSFYMKIFFIRMRLIDEYLSFGLLKENNLKEINLIFIKDIPSVKVEIEQSKKDVNEFDTAKLFLKNILYTARRKPFLFLSELELKLNFIINPYIKFKSSISIESMNKKLLLDHIHLNNYFSIYSYLNSDEISGFILAKIIKNFNNNSFKIKDSKSPKEEFVFHYKNNNSNNNLSKKEINKNEKEFMDFEIIDKIETKSYNRIMNDNLSKKVYSSEKSSIQNSSIDKNSENENNSLNWDEIKANILIKLPPLCYKMKFKYENNKKNNQIFSTNYHIPDCKIFYEHFSKIEIIFKNIYSCNGKIERTLLHCLIPIYLLSFYIYKNKEEAQTILKQIQEIYNSGCYFLNFAYLFLINLFQGLSCEAYLDSEEYYSKSVMLLLMLFGDPRGRNNDSHPMMLLPLWEICRKTMKLEKELPGNNQYFYEMFKSLEFFNDSKGKINSNKNNIHFNYEKNILNNIKIIIEVNDIPIETGQSNINEESSSINNFINTDFYINKNIFNDDMLDLYAIKQFKFPSFEEDKNNVIKRMHSKEFIIFLFKQIQSILIGNYKVFDEKYINDYISDEIFILNKKEKKRVSLKDSYSKNFNKSSINIKADFHKKEIEFSPSQLINAFQQGKKILDIFSFNKDNNSKENIKNSPHKKLISQFKINKKPNFSTSKKTKGKVGIFSHFLYDELLYKLSYKNNAPYGIVVSFGNNSHNETTYEDIKMLKYPLLIYKLKNLIVNKIYSGWEHNIIISNTNEIYSFGNNNNFQCGVPFSKNFQKENAIIKNPHNISVLNGNIKGISAACGNEHTLILDENKNVYSFGNNEDCVLGVENNELKSYSFIKVNFGKYNGRINDISAGTIHNIALTDDGNIFSWGSAQGGQLGLSENYLIQPQFKNKLSVSSPTLISIKQSKNIEEPTKIIKVSCGEAHTIVLTSKKEVYSWGFGSNGQLGLGFCEDSFELGTGLTKSRIFTPQKIKSLNNKKIIDIQCGKTFSMFIDSTGGLYSCGVNDLNQLGIPDSPPKSHIINYDSQCKDFVIPTKLEFFLNMKVEKISCGEAHCLAIVKDHYTNERFVWSWGNNRYGQLGLGDKIKISLPKPITFLFEYKDNRFESVSCGGFHSLCLIKQNENIKWIEDDFKYKICKIINDIWND